VQYFSFSDFTFGWVTGLASTSKKPLIHKCSVQEQGKTGEKEPALKYVY